MNSAAVDKDGDILVLDYHCNQCGAKWTTRPAWFKPTCPECGVSYIDYQRPKYWNAFIGGRMVDFDREKARDLAVEQEYRRDD